ncbi:nacht domain-containing protein isoform 1 [Fusarium sporotrichioides]|uniref:Nacht domain-containing protein isoform 1 n=1 Tax=Fusarium sporotrichioides TaxID=5514 RepID=A0A395RNB4_FUSSP|nr:nacht domain-containing protein isoform 1 [Fusarium sporotrichioides]
MAELAAIALVGNILQFVEVGIKLTRTAQRAYKSASGLIQEDEEFLANTKRLQTLVGLIDQSQSNPEDARQTSIDENLLQTAKACDEYASQLESLLDTLRRRPEQRKKLDAIRTVVLRRLRNTEIQALEGKLINVQKTQLIGLTASSHSRLSSVLVAIRELKQQNAVLGANTTTKLEAIESLIRSIDLKNGNMSNAAKMIISHLDNLVSEAQRVKKHHNFLKSLRFREIKQRHSAIQDHHKATFRWVFTKGKTSFREWLEEGSGFFWVKGKAGSGKSTLMKFIATHDETQSLLRTWGDGYRVITASHFFWNAGLSMQKSLTGLFQTILYQVLRECPELIDIIENPRQESSTESKLYDAWDDKALFRAFEQLSSQQSLPLRFCFFIDGLDEYTAGEHRYTGTFEELLSPLRVLASSPSIKICVSSRPWDAFDREFSHVNWKLQLEDLTREDIRRYVKEELGVNPKFQQLSEMDPRCSEIKDTIVQRAQGVFLWVYLVVNSLKRGLLKDDNYIDMQSRLNELPDDLQRYFEHMLQSIETIYWDSTTRIFRTVIAAEQPLPLLAFELLDREMDDPDYALTMQASPLTDVESKAICTRSNTRLNARCGDLLYVTVDPTETGLFKSQVDFLHRTVRDFFLDTGVIDDMIQKRPTEKFDPNLSLCRIMLGLNKIISLDENASQVDNQLFIIADGLMHYARNVEETFTRLKEAGKTGHDKTSLKQVFEILDELDRTNSKGLNHLGAHWTNRKDPPQGTFREGRNKTFLAATIQARLALYAADNLQKNPAKIRQKSGRPLLDYALRPTMVTPLQIIHLEQGPVLPIVELLLDLGADPNAGIYIYENRTPWELFLELCHQHAKKENKSEYLLDDIGRAMELMVERGARTNGTFHVSQSRPLIMMEIANAIELPQHNRSRIEELFESREKGRSFLSRMFGWK